PGSDMTDEVAQVTRVIEGLNAGQAKSLGLELERIEPNHADTKGWDIFVGLIWLRFDPAGVSVDTPGTEAAFSEARQEAQAATQGWPKALFLRNIQPPVDMLHFDMGQYARVQQFFEGLASGSARSLVQLYSQPEEFARFVREHIENFL